MVKIDLDKIINKARSGFQKSEKGLGLQIISGSGISKPSKDSDFVCWPNSSWELLTGIRGCPFGRIVQIAGKPDSGKSTHAMEFMKRAQEQGHIVILWDSENKFSATRYKNYFGGDIESLIVITSKLILEGADLVRATIEACMEQYPDRKIFIVWDSVGGSMPSSESELDMRSSRQMAEAAKENGRAVRGFIQLMERYRDRKTNEHKIAVLLINQTYSQIKMAGQKESGGQKVEFFSSIIVQLARKGYLHKVRNKVKRRVGITTVAKVRKNHLFDGEDTIAELDLDVVAGGVFVNAKSPALALVSDAQKQTEEFEEAPDDEEAS